MAPTKTVTVDERTRPLRALRKQNQSCDQCRYSRKACERASDSPSSKCKFHSKSILRNTRLWQVCNSAELILSQVFRVYEKARPAPPDGWNSVR